MTTYPKGVMQNYATQNMPMELKEVPESNWRMFAPPKEAQEGLKMIQTCVPNAFMQAARTNQYAQFVYLVEPPPIVVRIAYGNCVPQEGGEPVRIEEYPSDIYDRSQKPQPFVDSVEQGKTPTLKCRRVTPDLGQLYWTTL